MGKRNVFLLVLLSSFYTLCFAQQKPTDEIPFAWCIVPYDKMERSPTDRIQMLKELGITKYAYDWREKHIPSMVEEFKLAQKNGIEINAVWIWVSPEKDEVGALSTSNEQLFKAVKESGLKTTFWLGINPSYYEGLSDEQSLEKSAEVVYYLYERAAAIGCKVALYNHLGWFEPENQIRIIKRLGRYDIKLVYNFHHAHNDLDHFDTLVKKMMPYLSAVNLNGMRSDAKIYPLGQGEHEKGMVKTLLDAGYRGPFGILGHDEKVDVKFQLERNLAGYKSIMKSL